MNTIHHAELVRLLNIRAQSSRENRNMAHVGKLAAPLMYLAMAAAVVMVGVLLWSDYQQDRAEQQTHPAHVKKVMT